MNVINQDAGVVYPRYKGPVTREGYEANRFAGMSEEQVAARLVELQKEEEAIAEAVSSRPRAVHKKKSATETTTEA